MKYIKIFFSKGRTSELSLSRWDTIVEVLLAVAVLGTVLGTGYVVVNRNVKSAQASQERHQAIKLAESQFEKLKIFASSNGSVFVSPDFCLSSQNTLRLLPSPDCMVDAAGAPTILYPRYRLAIHNEEGVDYGGTTTGVRFKISVVWENVRGNGDDRLDYFYEVYR